MNWNPHGIQQGFKRIRYHMEFKNINAQYCTSNHLYLKAQVGSEEYKRKLDENYVIAEMSRPINQR